MNRRHIVWLIAGVVLAHLAAFYFVADWNALPKAAYIAPPSFVAKEASWTDEATGKTVTYREFQVSTKLTKLEGRVETAASADR